jgi:hypothetical protein
VTTTVDFDLCHSNYGNGDTHTNPSYCGNEPWRFREALDAADGDLDKRRQAYRENTPATYFKCASKADNVISFPCTGSKHLDHKTVIRCSCACHHIAMRGNQ